jgi:hypothetical protein
MLAASLATILFHLSCAVQYVKVHIKNGQALTGVYHTYYSSLSGKEKKIIQINRGGRKVTPSETDSVIVDFLVGLPSKDNSGWLFRIIDGTICAYSTEPDRKTKKLSYIQKSQGTLEPFSRSLLAEYLSDNKMALNVFKKTFERSETRMQEEGAIEAILEYNFQKAAKRRMADSLLKLMTEEKELPIRSNYARNILEVDSTNYMAFEVLGDYELAVNRDEEKACYFYNNAVRYHPRRFAFTELRYKIDSLNRKIMY